MGDRLHIYYLILVIFLWIAAVNARVAMSTADDKMAYSAMQ